MLNYKFNFENCCLWKFIRGAAEVVKTITGLFPLSWQDGIGGDLVDYSITGASGGVGDYGGKKNQLVDTATTSVTLVSGHKYFKKISGTESIVTGDGSAVSVTGGVDNVIDLTLMFPNETITDVATAKSRIAEVMGGQQEYYPYDSGTDYYKVPMVVTSGCCVDLGTLNWAYEPTDTRFCAVDLYPPAKRINVYNRNAFISNNKYEIGETSSQYSQLDKVFSGYLDIVLIHDESYTDATAFKQAMSGVFLYYQRATDSSWYIQNKTAYTEEQLTAGQTISMLQDNLPHFTELPTGYLQMGVDTAVQPSGGSVTYKSRSVSI